MRLRREPEPALSDEEILEATDSPVARLIRDLRARVEALELRAERDQGD